MKKLLSIALILVLALSAAALAETPAYQETVVSIDAGDHQIPATICVPTEGENFPAVVMLHGTASNRDEAGGGYQIAAPILAEKYGVATIRIDFMGNGDSTADYMGYTFESAVGDAVAAAEYVKTVVDMIEILPPHFVIHRVTGDGPKNLLIAPTWSADKKNVLNNISREFKNRNTYQGKEYRHGS